MSSALTLDDWLDHEDSWLAPGALRNRDSRGRRHLEPAHEYRSPFQRDRERIVYSSSFRRMTGKTHLLCAIGQELVRSGRRVLFTPCHRLVQ